MVSTPPDDVRQARPGHDPEFNSDLARVIFVDADLPGAVRVSQGQRRLVDRLVEMIDHADTAKLHAMVNTLEQQVLPILSTEAMLEVAVVIQRAAPWMLHSMPRLAAHASRLRRAEEMAAVFSRDSLTKLAQALKQEAAR